MGTTGDHAAGGMTLRAIREAILKFLSAHGMMEL
jgi:hypothetical protein